MLSITESFAPADFADVVAGVLAEARRELLPPDNSKILRVRFIVEPRILTLAAVGGDVNIALYAGETLLSNFLMTRATSVAAGSVHTALMIDDIFDLSFNNFRGLNVRVSIPGGVVNISEIDLATTIMYRRA